MAKVALYINPYDDLQGVANYYNNVSDAIRLYYSSQNINYVKCFAGYRVKDIIQERDCRFEELDATTSFKILTIIEAAFFSDFDYRCNKRKKDVLSKTFKRIRRITGSNHISLKKHILKNWKDHHASTKYIISSYIGALNYRNWLAHGKRWFLDPNIEKQYDFHGSFAIAQNVFTVLPLNK